MVIIWLVLGVLLLAAELHHQQLYLVFAAAGAFAAAVVAIFLPGLIAVQVVAAAVVVIAGVRLLRPLVMRPDHASHAERVVRGIHGALVGEEVLTLDEVGDGHEPGHVRLAGETWLAVSIFEAPIPAGTRALVVGVRGTTLQVSPLTDGEIGLL